MRATKRKFRVTTGLIAIWLVLAIMLQFRQIGTSQRDERAFALQQTEHRAGQLAIAVAEHIAVFTRAVDFVLLELRQEYGMQDAHFRQTVTLLLKSFPERTILQFSVADANGDLTYSNLGLTQAVNVRDREHFTAYLDGADRLFISKPVLGRVSKQWSIQFTRPVLRNGRFAGVIVASVAPEYLGKILALLDLGPTDSATLFDASGAFLARSREVNELMGKSVPPSAPFLAADAPARGVFRAAAYADNTDRIFGWARVPGTSLVTNVDLDVNLVRGPMEQQFRQAWIDAGAFALGLVALGGTILVLVLRLGQRQQALAASEARFRELTELSADWYWEQDDQFRFTFRSTEFRGDAMTPQDALGKRRWEAEGFELSEAQRAEHKAVLEAHQPFYGFEFWRRYADGRRMYVSVSGRPIFSAEGAFVGYRGVSSDITQRKQAEDALRQSEQRFRDLIELSTDWYWEQDADLRFSMVSEGVHSKGGLVPTSVLGKRRWELPIVSISEEQWQAHRALLARCEPFHDFSYEIVGENDVRHWYSVSGKPQFGADGQFLGYRGTGHDITERVYAERALRESEARLREAQRMAHLGNWELDLVNNALTWSDEIPRIFEIEPERSGASYEDFLASVHPDDRDAVNTASTRSARERVPYEITHRLLMTDGRIKHVHVRYETAYDEHGRPLRSTGTVQDISEQKQVEAELRGYAHRLREVSRRLAQVQEMERRQVAGELHDSMGRDLTALAINLDLIRAQLPAQVLAGVEERLDDAQALVGAAMQNVRSVVAGLRPALLEEWGLLPALRWYAVEFSKRAAIPVDVVITGQEARLPDEAELALFRVAQEALLNCTKHARASRIDISLEMIPGRATLTITDDGAGFIVENLDSGRRTPGLGLALMHERMEAVGGRLRMVSSPGRGTRITAAIES
jgi:PAS domain S-box-containing protein